MYRKIIFYFGIILLGFGIARFSKIAYFYYHSQAVGHHLLEHANKMIAKDSEHMPIPKKKVKKTGLIGKMEIPALSLSAPIIEGTQDDKLSIAVGHLTSSNLPGDNGTCILAAHNVTWFQHIDQLHAGDKIKIFTKKGISIYQITNTKIVHVGYQVLNTPNPSIVLETCYPLNALYLTPYRFLVFGDRING